MRSTEWKYDIRTHVARSIMLFVAIACVLMCQISICIFASLAAAAFSLLFMYDDRRRIYSVAAVLVSLVLTGVIQWLLLPACLCSMGVGACVAWFYRTGRPKFDVALVSVGLYLFMFFLLFWLSAAYELSDASLSSSLSYYTEQLTAIKESLLSEWQVIFSETMGDQTSEWNDLLSEVFDTVITRIPAIVAVICLVMTGICLKTVSVFVSRLNADAGEQIRRWSFATPILFAYFYGVIFLLSLFFVGDSVFALAIGNLQLFFMCMYAYVGFKYLRFISKRSQRRHPMVLLILVMFFIMPSVAFQLLSIEGVIAVITAHRMQNNRNNGQGTGL